MVEVTPFRGLRYAPKLRHQPVYSPPYDVIDTAERERLLASSPYNVVHVTLGPKNAPEHWYEEAAQRLSKWRAQGILLRDQTPALYAYEQAFDGPQGTPLVRRGLFARVRLVPWGEGIHPHERTHSGPKADRLRLMRSLHAQESPVFGLYRDAEGTLENLLGVAPADAITTTDADDVRHTCWKITDRQILDQAATFLRSRDIVIADGHHRYETALAYRDEVRRQRPAGNWAGAHNYVFMYLTAAESPGLVILPTHRIVTTPLPVGDDQLRAALASSFELRPVTRDEDLPSAIAARHNGELTLGMRLPSGAWTLTLRDRRMAHSAIPAGQPKELAELDVCVLQNLVLAPHLGISSEDLTHGDAVRYTIHPKEACAAVAEGQAAAAFLLGPTATEQVWRVAIAGVTMPQKSTYFYPKLLTGLVMNPLVD
ncbi:MAG: DUF1015 domain-containing protein [Anaerolineae bacterium]